jgi:hypothetical protein
VITVTVVNEDEFLFRKDDHFPLSDGEWRGVHYVCEEKQQTL